MAYFPLFWNMDGREIYVIGGGTIGTRRIDVLLPFGCRITVISPVLSKPLAEMADDHKITWVKERYEDCREWLWKQECPFAVLAASDVREVNHMVALDCKCRRIPVNTADCKEESDFYFPGIARKGDVTVGITAGGKNHRLASDVTVEIQQLLEERITDILQ